MKKYQTNNVIDILKQDKAIITDSHFVYTSGYHGSVYINKDAIYPYTKKASLIGKMMADKYKDKKIDVVAGPALGGIVLSQWTAYHISKINKKNVLGIYTEKDPDKNQLFKRGYDKLIKEKKVLVVEDLTTTGGSVRKVVDSVENAGGDVVGVCVMVNRDPKKVNSAIVGAPFTCLGILKAKAYKDLNLDKMIVTASSLMSKPSKTNSK